MEGLCWMIYRRFSQFETLREELSKQFPKLKLPSLPSKHIFQSKFDSRLIGERVLQFQKFLDEILDNDLGSVVVCQSSIVLNWVDITKNVSLFKLSRNSSVILWFVSVLIISFGFITKKNHSQIVSNSNLKTKYQ